MSQDSIPSQTSYRRTDPLPVVPRREPVKSGYTFVESVKFRKTAEETNEFIELLKEREAARVIYHEANKRIAKIYDGPDKEKVRLFINIETAYRCNLEDIPENLETPFEPKEEKPLKRKRMASQDVGKGKQPEREEQGGPSAAKEPEGTSSHKERNWKKRERDRLKKAEEAKKKKSTQAPALEEEILPDFEEHAEPVQSSQPSMNLD